MAIAKSWTHNTLSSFWDVLVNNWHLGFTAFGGPPVHFQIFHEKFVTELEWVDEQTYQELFAVCQALSGPASTKVLYVLNLVKFGFLPAVFAFLVWSLPGALGMYGLSIAASHISENVPKQVYALLSGLNAATVGIVLLAAVQLSQRFITDKVTRILVFISASAGLLYSAVWYIPVLMFLAGCVTVINDYEFLHKPVKRILRLFSGNTSDIEDDVKVEMGQISPQGIYSTFELKKPSIVTHSDRRTFAPSLARASTAKAAHILGLTVSELEIADKGATTNLVSADRVLTVAWQMGVIIIVGFFITFTVFMILRGVLRSPSLLYRIFANMYLAGTIIFGGGPVVTPLLREYVVAEGWVSPRDFLIGLAIIQAFPGPNFNFAVYLGSLAAIGGGYASAWGALIAYIGIFVPGLIIIHGAIGLWNTMRDQQWVKSGLRGINAAAVGLIYTAVYHLWQFGFINESFQAGTSLGDDPWWVIVTATSFVGGYWFGLNAPLSIILGAIMGLVRYGVVND